MMDTEPPENYLKVLMGRGARAWKTHRQQLALFLRWLSSKNLALPKVNPGLVNEYLCYRKHLGRKLKTMRMDLCILRCFFRWARQEGLITGDPAQGVSCFWLKSPGGFPAYRGHLRKILHKPLTILKHTLPLFAPHWEEYIGLLLERGHTRSHLRNVLNRNRDFHQYLVSRKTRRLTHVTPRFLNDFLRLEGARFRKVHGRSIPKHYLWKTRGPIKGFLTYAFSRHNKHFLKPRKSPDSLVLPDSLLDRYMEFCRIHRGLRLVTREGYRRDILRLRSFLDRRRIGRIQEMTLTDLDDFLLHHGKHLGIRGLQSIATALRAFLRYLHLNGDISRDLARNVLSPRRFHADLRPKYLPWKKIEQLLASVNRNTPGGKRDYAILVLLACHGLRAREAAGLRTGDINWITRSFLLRETKNGTTAQIPISQETTEALRDYLSVRPEYSYPEFFLTTYAPIKPLGRALCDVAAGHLHKCFGRLPHRGGAYALRHSYAKALLDRGAKLHEIGTMLGHRSLRSTLIYTRIATEELREVADNYANLSGK